jgi:thiol:disulfide interchange protein
MNRRSLVTLAAVAVAGAFLTRNACAAGHDFPDGSPKFETKYKSALSEAKKTGKPVLLVFSATWCGPCQANKKNVYPSAAVKPYHDKFVWAYLDADEAANKKAMTEYGVNGIPHIQFLDKDGKSIDKMVGASTPEGFAKKLQEVLGKTGGASTSAPEKPAVGIEPKKPASETTKKKS